MPQAFVAKGDNISKLWNLLSTAVAPPSATAHCADSLVRRFETLDQLTSYENSKRATITALELSARTRDGDMSAEVSLGGRFSAPISVSLRGEEDQVSPLRTSLTDVLNGMRPWYSHISTIDLLYISLPILFLAQIGASVVGAVAQGLPPARNVPINILIEKAIYFTAYGVATMIGIGLIIWASVRLRRRFFPVATFAIGQGFDRHQYDEQIRWVVIIGFLVGVAASIFAGVLVAI